MRRLRLGIIGTGIAATDLHLPQLKKLSDKIEIVAVANRRLSKAVAFAKKAGVKKVCKNGEELLAMEQVEAVLLSLPIDLNAAWVLKSLAAGKHVVCEKPLAANSAEGRRLVASAAKYKKTWLVAENYFFAPHIKKAREWARSNRIGELRLLEVSQLNWMEASNKYYKTPWRQNPRFSGGFVTDAGVHLADIAREILGMPVAVKAMTARFNPILRPIDSAVAVLRFKKGVLGLWRSCFSAPPGAARPSPIVLRGSKGTIEIGDGWALLTPLKGKPLRSTSKENGFYHEFSHFADVIVRGDKLAFTPRQALDDLIFMEKLLRA